MKRRTPKEIIEKGNPKTEQAYIKFPREEPIKVNRKEDEEETRVMINLDLIKGLLSKDKIHNKYTQIHTHGYIRSEIPNALPSGSDLETFYRSNKQKAEIIAQQNVQTGEVSGYTVLLKKMDRKDEYSNLFEVKYPGLFGPFKEIYLGERLSGQAKKYNKGLYTRKISPKEGYNKLKEICEKQDWNLRFVPAKGYYFDKETGNFEKKKGIEKIVASVIGGFIIIASLFNLYKLNAFVISEEINSQSRYFILIFIIFTFVFGVFMIFKKSKINKKQSK